MSRKLAIALNLAFPAALIAVWGLRNPDNALFDAFRAVARWVPDLFGWSFGALRNALPFAVSAYGFYAMKRALNAARALRSRAGGDAALAMIAGACFWAMTRPVEGHAPLFAAALFAALWGALRIFPPRSGSGVRVRVALAASGILLVIVVAFSVTA